MAARGGRHIASVTRCKTAKAVVKPFIERETVKVTVLESSTSSTAVQGAGSKMALTLHRLLLHPDDVDHHVFTFVLDPVQRLQQVTSLPMISLACI